MDELFGGIFDLDGDGETELYEQLAALDMLGVFDEPEGDPDEDED